VLPSQGSSARRYPTTQAWRPIRTATNRALDGFFFLSDDSVLHLHDPFSGADSVVGEGVAIFDVSPDGLAAIPLWELAPRPSPCTAACSPTIGRERTGWPPPCCWDDRLALLGVAVTVF
jgi:hypothetical protein